MKKRWKRTLFWLPRIIAIVFAAFISIFALDVFAEYSFPVVLWALLMHLIPTILLVVLLIIAWKWPKWGGMLFILLAIIFTLWFNLYRDLISFLLIGLPVLVLGILFLVDWKVNRKT